MRKIWLVLAILIVFVGLIGYSGLLKAEKVKAAGTTTVEITADIGYWNDTGGALFTTQTHEDFKTWVSGSLVAYIETSTTTNYWKLKSGMGRFDLSSIPDGAEVVNMYATLYCTGKTTYGSPSYDAPYISLYDTSAGANGVMDDDDCDQFNDGQVKKRISSPQPDSEFAVGATTTVEIPECNWDIVMTPDDNDYTYLYVTTEYYAMDWVPTQSPWSESRGYNRTFNSFKLVIEYASAANPVEFEYQENDAIDTTVVGDEEAEDIALDTPACMYAAEDLEVCVSGDSGASISLELIDDEGTVLTSLSDSIRVNGYYYWRINPTWNSSYSGFVRVREAEFGLVSDWISIQPQYSSAEANLKTYAVNTEYPQYGNELSMYTVQAGDYMYVHWKTNIDMSTEMADSGIEMYLNGDSDNPFFSAGFTELTGSYFKGTEANQEASLHWRYMVFTPFASSGTNLYGGLVWDLSIEKNDANYGFIQSMITYDGEELTETHSAYWFLENASDGISVKITDSTVDIGEAIEIVVSLGSKSNVEYYLKNCAIDIGSWRSAGSVIKIGENRYTIDGITSEGEYTVTFTFSSDYCSYQYVVTKKLTVVEGGYGSDGGGASSEDIWKQIQDWLDRMGWLTTVGKYLLIFGLMVVLYVLAHKNKVMSIVLPCCVLVVGILVKWINPWIVALIAIGVGLIVWQAFMKKARGGG